MAEEASPEHAARILRHAFRRRADGSRGIRARWAWGRLLRACAAGDPVAQEAVRTAELPEADVLDLLAAAPKEPADQAAYLTMIGQHAQRQALDPDGSLLALAYRAAPAQVRERLRTEMTAAGDSTAIRVVVTGDRRDRLATLSYDEAGYLSRRLAHHQDWDELRRLAADLPPAEAAVAAGLLPPRERTGRDAESLALLAGQSGDGLRALSQRLPATPLTEYTVGLMYGEGPVRASFSPDLSELAVVHLRRRGVTESAHEFDLHTLRVGTGAETDRGWCGLIRISRPPLDCAVLHLGDEILVQAGPRVHPERIVRVRQDTLVFDLPEPAVSAMHRASGGAVMLGSAGLVFADRGADDLRHQPIPGFRDMTGPGGFASYVRSCALATLPSARLIAFSLGAGVHVVDEDGTALHQVPGRRKAARGEAMARPGLFLHTPNTLSVRYGTRKQIRTWELSPEGARRVPDVTAGPFRWSSGPDTPFGAKPRHATDSGYDVRYVVERSPWGDTRVHARTRGQLVHIELESPHLPLARELLRRPLAHGDPQQLRKVQELLPRIGDPAVRDALDVLQRCLEDRFGSDIALGPGGPAPTGGPTDIALAR
ncbi:hypothetical protein [Streptomyces blattellae]|uniref:hypothetical protein n=1 Tax=Streptomyces blattellae TaxID=2569855 RepID=UPI0012B8F2E8|nr:hypothetical protein [Streptomyces blattellae]